MNNLSSYCGLVDAKIRASDKDLPVQSLQQPPPMSLCLSSESLASICSGLQALDSGVADISEEIDNNTTDYQIIKMDERSISSHVFTISEYSAISI